MVASCSAWAATADNLRWSCRSCSSNNTSALYLLMRLCGQMSVWICKPEMFTQPLTSLGTKIPARTGPLACPNKFGHEPRRRPIGLPISPSDVCTLPGAHRKQSLKNQQISAHRTVSYANNGKTDSKNSNSAKVGRLVLSLGSGLGRLGGTSRFDPRRGGLCPARTD
jgi:hypothetical protein